MEPLTKNVANLCTYKLTSMTFFFSRLRVGYPEPLSAPQDWENSWRIFTICTGPTRSSCTTRADVGHLNAKDKADARLSFISFTNKAQTGQNLSDLYDEKQCHEAHSFKLNEHDTNEFKIFRIWGSGVIRIYFIYFPERQIVILKTWPKRKDKLNNGEKLELEQIAKAALKCIAKDGFKARII